MSWKCHALFLIVVVDALKHTRTVSFNQSSLTENKFFFTQD